MCVCSGKPVFFVVPCSYYSNGSGSGSAAVLQWSVNEPCVGPNIFLMLPDWRHHFLFFCFPPACRFVYLLLFCCCCCRFLCSTSPVVVVAVVAFTAAFWYARIYAFFCFCLVHFWCTSWDSSGGLSQRACMCVCGRER